MSITPAPPTELRRDFTTRSAFALAFAFISPIIGLYAIFALGLAAAGASLWWAFPVVLAGQVLVALVLAELASVWPRAGGLYQWGHEMLGRVYGWISGWAYVWTLVALCVATCYAATPFVFGALGLDEPSTVVRVLVALVVLGVATGANLVGRGPLKVFVVLSICAEVIASVGIGTVLLLFHRENGLGDLMTGVGQGAGGLPAPATFGGILAAVALVGWAFIGFESAADIAEEVREPERAVPKALIVSLVLVASVVTYAALALILAIPDLPAVVAGEVEDPIQETIAADLGAWIVTPLYVIVTTGFVAGLVAAQAALSRVLYAQGRRGELPGARHLTKLSRAEGLPQVAIVVSAVVSGAVLVLAVALGLYDTLIALATVGFYVSFALPIFALLVHRRRHGWAGGAFSLGRLSLPVNVLAALWLAFQVVNIAWPRPIPDAPWFVVWGCLLMVAAVAALGMLAWGLLQRRERPAPAAAEGVTSPARA